MSVQVPANAVVKVNNRLTTSTGAERTFVSRDLKIDSQYEYVFKVDVVREGITYSKTQTVNVKAFDELNLVFDFDQDEAAAEVASR